VAALVSGNAWLFVLVVVLMLAWTGWLVLRLLAKVLDSSRREVRVRLRLNPWPDIEIETKPR
jgi:hypothetical protein